jgi:hypothetical protein
MPRKIGRYHVRQGNADVPFWPLPPDKLDLVAGIETVAWVAPVTTGSGSNTLVAPPDFGIFDVLIEFTMDQIEEFCSPTASPGPRSPSLSSPPTHSSRVS